MQACKGCRLYSIEPSFMYQRKISYHITFKTIVNYKEVFQVTTSTTDAQPFNRNRKINLYKIILFIYDSF